jgi:hypothetical protein
MLVRLLTLIVLGAFVAATGCSSGSVAPASPPSSVPIKIEGTSSVAQAVTDSPLLSCADEVKGGPTTDPNETEVYLCQKLSVPPSTETWVLVVRFYRDSSFATQQHRADCQYVQTDPSVDGYPFWFIWKPGQLWTADVRTPGISPLGPLPSEDLVATVARVLGSVATNCSPGT